MLVFALFAMHEKRLKQGWLLGALFLCLCLGPKDSEIPGFQRYWGCYVAFLTTALMGYFVELKPSPRFWNLIQKIHPSKYYARCQLVGAMDHVQNRGSLFCFHPHGVLATGYGWNGIWSKAFRDAAGYDTQFAIDKVLREDNPFWKVICDLHGSVMTLNKKSLKTAMAQHLNVAFIPGGFQDATCMVYGEHSTVMKDRKGFIRYALEYGYRVHPVYTFGESETFYTCSALLRFRLWLNRFGIPAVLVFGFRWLPFVPRWQPELLTAVGEPVELPKIQNPTPADVDKWHGAYVKALQTLFDDKKESAGLAKSVQLQIL